MQLTVSNKTKFYQNFSEYVNFSIIVPFYKLYVHCCFIFTDDNSINTEVTVTFEMLVNF